MHIFFFGDAGGVRPQQQPRQTGVKQRGGATRKVKKHCFLHKEPVPLLLVGERPCQILADEVIPRSTRQHDIPLNSIHHL